MAFFGDSTIDGVNTTDWQANTVGMDSISPNSFSKKLEGILRKATGNEALRIYNAGFSGQIASWASANLEPLFGPTSAYADVKMIGIGFGINDRLMYPNEKAYRDGFEGHIRDIIEWCYSKRIQPFLLTTQAILQPGVMTIYADEYPMRTNGHIDSVANEVKRELAEEYRLPLIDMSRLTERFLLYSSYSSQSIISDRLHFGDVGHQYEAELLFARLCPMTLAIEGYAKIDYSTQRISNCVPEDWLTMPEEPKDPFKVYVDYSKAENSDTKIMTAWVFVDSTRALTLKAFKGTPSSSTYLKINGVTLALKETETNAGVLDLGLHRLEVFSGVSTHLDFKGFIIE
ncbi:SGNH/GDSL hydrolase family protein [Cohnella yongneupensis]|uniref:SGNH/GDSL hydrolase family protein n=1 Tax=Cohnella yongneupensis TaxID=425006 RepID=A0ABW0QTK9_9BACL